MREYIELASIAKDGDELELTLLEVTDTEGNDITLPEAKRMLFELKGPLTSLAVDEKTGLSGDAIPVEDAPAKREPIFKYPWFNSCLRHMTSSEPLTKPKEELTK